jgi:hypothetical protein
MRQWVAGASLLAVASAAVVWLQSADGWPESTRSCTTAELKITLVHSGAAAGTVGGYIGFINRTARPCRLTGWPALVAVTAAGDTTTARHRRSTMFGPRPNIKGFPVITIRRGQRADAVFTGTDIAGPGKTTCGRPYRYLRVTPPGNSHSVLVSAWLPALDAYLPRCGRIDVSMVVRASALYHG